MVPPSREGQCKCGSLPLETPLTLQFSRADLRQLHLLGG